MYLSVLIQRSLNSTKGKLFMAGRGRQWLDRRILSSFGKGEDCACSYSWYQHQSANLGVQEMEQFFFSSPAFYYCLVFTCAGERSVISVYSGFSPFLGVVAAYQECQNADVGVYVKKRVDFGLHDSSLQSARSLPTHCLSHSVGCTGNIL